MNYKKEDFIFYDDENKYYHILDGFFISIKEYRSLES